jgi:hypothetical protein
LLKIQFAANEGGDSTVPPRLLKIQFGTSEGRYEQHRATSPILRSSTLIAMMQAANLREGNNVIACEG